MKFFHKSRRAPAAAAPARLPQAGGLAAGRVAHAHRRLRVQPFDLLADGEGGALQVPLSGLAHLAAGGRAAAG